MFLDKSSLPVLIELLIASNTCSQLYVLLMVWHFCDGYLTVCRPMTRVKTVGNMGHRFLLLRCNFIPAIHEPAHTAYCYVTSNLWRILVTPHMPTDNRGS